MNFKTLAQSRYTTKSYNENKKVSSEKIASLQEILRLSPSSINSQPWKFIFVSDENKKKQLAKVSYFNENRINQASHLVVFTAISSIDLFEEQIAKNIPAGAVAYYNQFLKPNTEEVIKSWLNNQVYLSLGFFLSACASMQIDTTPMEGIQAGEYASILKLNEYKPLFAVALGYRADDDSNQPSVKPKTRLTKEQVIVSI